MTLHLVLLGAAVAADARLLTSDGEYSALGTPAAPQAASTAPRASPTERIVRGLAPTKSYSTAAASGACCSGERAHALVDQRQARGRILAGARADRAVREGAQAGAVDGDHAVAGRGPCLGRFRGRSRAEA